jgi:methylated-DNA-[protein]-cysteine S-methyltransferase
MATSPSSTAGGAQLVAGSFTLPGETLFYLAEGPALLYLGFAPPYAPGVRLPAALRSYLGGVELQAIPSARWPELERQLREYYAGERREFDLPLRLLGTPFQERVWRALLEIAYGHTVTYGEIAGAAGRPRAVRAAGSAVGSNPLTVIVPCHRVVPAGGGVGSYGGGPARKRRLLRLEGAQRVPEMGA